MSYRLMVVAETCRAGSLYPAIGRGLRNARGGVSDPALQ